MESGNIKPINLNSVHKICSGQVVLTLATAVKELVENSIDAGATIIEVKLKEYGSELIEVSDNGKGVKSSDFQSITLKHHTSKINDFSDVEFVSTFGFRGEALSSLCALSDVEIITCDRDSQIGSLLVYDHNGELMKRSSTHRQPGTTVILKNLFYTLPVRHKEFQRNIRREYTKMIQLLTAYCLISTKKRITCTNTTDKGRKNIVLSTNSSDTFKDNISCIFGCKQVNNLMEFIQHTPSESVLEEYFLPKSDLEKCKIFCIEGYISNSTHGEGRSSADRQFFFINGRPCDLPKISKLINEIYHSFNKAQFPFVFFNIKLTEGSADVNVTPDKRQIFIPYEKLLLCIVKFSLQEMYQLQPSQMKMSSTSLILQKNSLSILFSKVSAENQKQAVSVSETTEETLKRKASSSMNDNEEDSQFSSPFKSMRKEKNSFSSESDEMKKDLSDDQVSPDSGVISVEEVSPADTPVERLSSDLEEKTSNQGSSLNIVTSVPLKKEEKISRTEHLKTFCLKKFTGLSKMNDALNSSTSSKKCKISKLKKESTQKIIVLPEKSNVSSDSLPRNLSSQEVLFSDMEDDSANFQEEGSLDTLQRRRKKFKTISFNLDALKKSLDAKGKTSLTENILYRKFRSKINPTENHLAEEELRKEIKKENFTEMDIIGQFNLGFIVARLNDDLFIIDQHATDEKYNFEILQKEVVLETQKLLNPLNLNLPAVSETILLDNLHIFEKSGFKFNIDEDNSVGKKIQLISVPVSQNWRFGKEDVDEMIFMLTDNPVSMIRPSKVNQMFASRACRKSVMIGTALTIPMMKKLVMHMGEMEQPWNCPHGRPTMRHLFNLNLITTESTNE